MKKKIIATECCSNCYHDGIDDTITWVIAKWTETDTLGIRVCKNCGFVQCLECHIDMETMLTEEGQFFYCPGCDLRIRIEWPMDFKRSNKKSKAYWDADYLEPKKRR